MDTGLFKVVNFFIFEFQSLLFESFFVIFWLVFVYVKEAHICRGVRIDALMNKRFDPLNNAGH